MAGRRLVFSNPEIIRILKDQFVCYAGDQWYLHRQQDAEGEFFWKVMDQGHRRNAPRDETRQGVYACTPDGRWLASRGFHPDPERTLEMLRTALQQWNSGPKLALVAQTSTRVDPQFDRKPPQDGVILRVFSRIPIPASPEGWNPNNATGRDHMWLTRDEWRSLIPTEWRKGAVVPIPKAVQDRLIRYHLIDSVRGEPTFWEAADVAESTLSLTVDDPAAKTLRLTGTARMKNSDGSRGYDSRTQGHLTFNPSTGRFARFDLLSWGDAWGSGRYTRRAPAGRFPLVVALSLAAPDSKDLVPPQASRGLPGYLTPGR